MTEFYSDFHISLKRLVLALLSVVGIECLAAPACVAWQSSGVDSIGIATSWKSLWNGVDEIQYERHGWISVSDAAQLLGVNFTKVRVVSPSLSIYIAPPTSIRRYEVSVQEASASALDVGGPWSTVTIERVDTWPRGDAQVDRQGCR